MNTRGDDMNMFEKIEKLGKKDCIVDFLYKETCDHICNHCGKCVFGYEGITQLQMVLKDISTKKAQTDDFVLLSDLSQLMMEQALCEDGKMIGEVVTHALYNYKEDFESHISRKECKAEVCTSFLTFHILASKCTGCNACIDVCEDNAILGKSKYIHVIDLDECIQCGKCLDVCEQNAIVTAGMKKPKGPKKPMPVKR